MVLFRSNVALTCWEVNARSCPKCGATHGVVWAPSGEVLSCPGCATVAAEAQAAQERTARKDEIDKSALSAAARSGTKDAVDASTKIAAVTVAAATLLNPARNRHSDETAHANADAIADPRWSYALTRDLEISLGQSYRDKYDVIFGVRVANRGVPRPARVYVIARLFAMQEFGPCPVGEDRRLLDFIVAPSWPGSTPSWVARDLRFSGVPLTEGEMVELVMECGFLDEALRETMEFLSFTISLKDEHVISGGKFNPIDRQQAIRGLGHAPGP